MKVVSMSGYKIYWFKNGGLCEIEEIDKLPRRLKRHNTDKGPVWTSPLCGGSYCKVRRKEDEHIDFGTGL